MAYNRQELESVDITVLAVLCGKAADNPSLDTVTREQAHKLKLEWAMLVAHETPPPADYKTHQDIEAEKAAVKKRMVELLAIL